MAGDDGVYVVGAGLAGLSCAHHLMAHGVNATVLEAADSLGGRVRTDVVDGFLLDRGFQVLLTSYPEATALLDYRALELHPFEPVALIRIDGRFVKVTDPFRHPMAALGALLAPVGGAGDKLRLARLRRRALREDLSCLLARPEAPTAGALAWYGFSPTMVERLFRPLFAGMLMDPRLDASSRSFELALRMLATGQAAIPSRGMAAIPQQLAAHLPGGVHLRRAATKVERGKLTLAGGEVLRPGAVVVATDGLSASWLLGEHVLSPPGSVPATCLYFATEHPPLDEPVLMLNAEGSGPVSHCCVPSAVSPTYAPPGGHLVSVTVLGPLAPGDELERAVVEQLADWFGSGVLGWDLLATYRIEHALPAQPVGALDPPERPVRLEPGLYLCGDHRDNASINGALASGRRAATAVLEDLRSGALD
jgi:phytoene dehydrogenase-like protein